MSVTVVSCLSLQFGDYTFKADFVLFFSILGTVRLLLLEKAMQSKIGGVS